MTLSRHMKVARYLPGLFVLLVACGFPPPPLIGDDAGPSGTCQRDEHCSSPTPYCIDTACAACRTSATCPTSTPVCDPTSHACRTCSKDSECDSGACDLAAGTCVDQSAILYASPTGNNANPCTQAEPCSLERASSIVDTAAHQYIVLASGVHRSNATFDGVSVTLCGHGSTIDASVTLVRSASVKLRDLRLVEREPNIAFGAGRIIGVNESNLTIDNVEFSSMGLLAIEGSGPTITIRNSRFINSFVFVSSHIIVDRSLFLSGAGINNLSSRTSDTRLEITNSIFIEDPNRTVVYINNNTDTTSSGSAIVVNNTFIGGSIACGGLSSYGKIFTSNIFYNTGTLPRTAGCSYNYNLITPAIDVGGMGNITGDPRFTDPTNNDFHLASGSPAVDAGPAQSSVMNDHDYDGTPRPQGLRSDIGAFEYVSSRGTASRR